MPAISPSDLQVLRASEYRVIPRIFVYNPQPVFKAQVGSGVEQGSYIIPYTNVTFGAYTDILPGMTLWVGSADGGRDLGTVRVRSATDTQIVVAENSDILWAPGNYITVVNFFEIWPVFPRIIQDPNDKEKVIFYKDYDIVYTNQNKDIGVLPVMGPHRAANGIPAQFYFSAVGTSPLRTDDTITEYLWSFPGGTPSSYSGITPGWVTYNSPGFYHVSLQVTLSNGVTETFYRHVIVYDTYPFSAVINSLTGSEDDSGYVLEATLYANDNGLLAPTQTYITDGALIILTTESVYDSVSQEFGGNYPTEERILFIGHIVGGSITYDYNAKSVTFTAASPWVYAKNIVNYSVDVEDKRNPNKWIHFYDLSVKRAIYHYLRWHTTIHSLYDIHCDDADVDAPIQFFSVPRGDVNTILSDFIRSARGGRICSDRQGGIWIEQHPAYRRYGYTNTPLMVSLTKDDYAQPEIQFREPTLAKVDGDGIAYSGQPGMSYTPYMATAPGNAAGARGRDGTVLSGFALWSGTELTELVGSYWAYNNYPIESASITMRTKYPFDLAPIESIELSLSAQDGLIFGDTTLRTYPREIIYNFQGFPSCTQQIALGLLLDGRVGVNVPVSPPPPEEPPIPPPPPIQPPPPEPPPPEPPPPVTAGPKNCLLWNWEDAWVTYEFDKTSPHWSKVVGKELFDSPADSIGGVGMIQAYAIQPYTRRLFIVTNGSYIDNKPADYSNSVKGVWMADTLGVRLKQIMGRQWLLDRGLSDEFHTLWLHPSTFDLYVVGNGWLVKIPYPYTTPQLVTSPYNLGAGAGMKAFQNLNLYNGVMIRSNGGTSTWTAMVDGTILEVTSASDVVDVPTVSNGSFAATYRKYGSNDFRYHIYSGTWFGTPYAVVPLSLFNIISTRQFFGVTSSGRLYKYEENNQSLTYFSYADYPYSAKTTFTVPTPLLPSGGFRMKAFYGPSAWWIFAGARAQYTTNPQVVWAWDIHDPSTFEDKTGDLPQLSGGSYSWGYGVWNGIWDMDIF